MFQKPAALAAKDTTGGVGKTQMAIPDTLAIVPGLPTTRAQSARVVSEARMGAAHAGARCVRRSRLQRIEDSNGGSCYYCLGQQQRYERVHQRCGHKARSESCGSPKLQPTVKSIT